MDWTNERYVRLYTRDTTTWRRLGWDGQNVLMHLLRKVDRSGCLELGELEPWEAVMLHIGCPEDAARRGMDALLRVGTVTIRDGHITLPSFVEAQECTKSDRQRAREYRERRSAGDFTHPAHVTKRDDMPSQNVTQSSRVDRTRHESTERVTPRHSVLCSAVQTSAEQEGDARGCALAPGADLADDLGEDLASNPPPAPEFEPGEPEPEPREKPRLQVMREAWVDASKAAGWETPPALTPNQLRTGVERASTLAASRRVSFAEAAALLATSAIQAARALRKAPGLALLDCEPGRPVADPRARGRPERARATTGKDFEGAEDFETQMARIGGKP